MFTSSSIQVGLDRATEIIIIIIILRLQCVIKFTLLFLCVCVAGFARRMRAKDLVEWSVRAADQECE